MRKKLEKVRKNIERHTHELHEILLMFECNNGKVENKFLKWFLLPAFKMHTNHSILMGASELFETDSSRKAFTWLLIEN